MKMNQELRHGDVTGGFNSSSLERSMEHARNSFLSSIALLQSGEDPKPYLLTSYALTLIGNYQVRDAIINEFENALDSLEDGRYSPAGIRECIAVWAAISEYMGMFGADKKVTVMGESSDFVESHFDDEGGELPLGNGKKNDNGGDNGDNGDNGDDSNNGNNGGNSGDKSTDFNAERPEDNYIIDDDDDINDGFHGFVKPTKSGYFEDEDYDDEERKATEEFESYEEDFDDGDEEEEYLVE